MTVNKEKLNTNENQKYDEIPISLLSEYADKVLAIGSQIKVCRNRSNIYLFLFSLLICATIAFFIAVYTIPIGIACLILLISTFSRFERAREECKLKIKYLNCLTQRLENLIRFFSQLQEHVLDDFSNRIELDLRLVDAESAIQYHKLLLKELNAPFPLTELLKGCYKSLSKILKGFARLCNRMWSRN